MKETKQQEILLQVRRGTLTKDQICWSHYYYGPITLLIHSTGVHITTLLIQLGVIYNRHS